MAPPNNVSIPIYCLHLNPTTLVDTRRDAILVNVTDSSNYMNSRRQIWIIAINILNGRQIFAFPRARAPNINNPHPPKIDLRFLRLCWQASETIAEAPQAMQLRWNCKSNENGVGPSYLFQPLVCPICLFFRCAIISWSQDNNICSDFQCIKYIVQVTSDTTDACCANNTSNTL